MKVLLDVSSYAWRALLAGEDVEHGTLVTNPETGKTRTVNSAMYGLHNLTSSIKKVCADLEIAPKDFILVLDGVGGKQLRTQFSSEYKAGRDKLPEMYKEYNQLEQEFCKQMFQLGAQVVTHTGVEADDIIGWFCENLTEDRLLVLTYDKDLLVCAKHPRVSVYIQDQLNPKLFGDFPFQFIDVYKATVGDTSDNIKGAKGFGQKAFEKLYAKFGDNGLAVLRELIKARRLTDLAEDVPDLPELQKLIDYASSVEVSLKCAQLYPQYIQAEKLEWQHGLNAAKATPVYPYLSHFQQQVIGVTSENFEQVFSDIKRQAADNSLVSLDIETSTPYESDEWLFDIHDNEKHGKVDVFGSELTGLSLTLGSNFQHTYYFAVDHALTPNCNLQQVEQVLLFLNPTHRFIIQNVNFELPVLHNTFGWFLRDVDDTKLMASYVDENESSGLKPNSKRWLGYDQLTYGETTGGRKMNQLTLAEVLDYGADDTICTAALYQWYQIHMMLENVWQVYRDVEIGAAYWTAQAFLDGVDISRQTLRGMIERDAELKSDEMKTLNQYLIEQGWDGCQFIPATDDTRHDPSWIKYAFEVVCGKPLETRRRRLDLICLDVMEQGSPYLVDYLISGSLSELNDYVQSNFTPKPDFNIGSPKQMQRLLYDVMGLPIRLRNKPTDNMRAAGLDGTPQTDELAIQTALHYDLTDKADQRVAVLQALLKIKTYSTREGLYYKTYPKLPHWKDGKIHAGLNQCATTTRRFSSSSPNLQQLSKGAGDFRQIFVPHHKNALIVSLDFSAQELRLTAHASQDPNMLACYVGDDLRDMHSLTGSGIAGMDYVDFKTILDDENHPRYKEIKSFRAIGKRVNFSELYGAQEKTMSQNLMCSEEEARGYIEAKARVFSGVTQWKTDSEAKAVRQGYSTTLLGARRHLPDLNSTDKWLQARAARQAVNFMIQGSGAEMTKLAMGRMWASNIRQRFDIRFIAPIHDEVVFSIAIDDIPKVLHEIHAAMTQQYADMTVPIESSVSMGKTFGEQHEMGDGVVPTPENVKQFLAKIL